GRQPYNPETDPQARNLPFHEKARKWVTGNLKGLNWANSNEATKQEGLTALFLLGGLFAGFSLNRQFLNPAREMSFPSLRGFGEGFAKHL
ncbi:hypothetical protein, partial [Salmonella enterica]|uniref:hypothetical protein n=1 Tax=Salmonella enterica TaxID=28901 RepID=UPI003D2B5ABB